MSLIKKDKLLERMPYWRLVQALTYMCEQYLMRDDGTLDHQYMTAGEHALECLEVLGMGGDGGKMIEYDDREDWFKETFTPTPTIINQQPEVTGEATVVSLALTNTALNKRIADLEDLLSSTYNIANRCGQDTHWNRFTDRLFLFGITPITAKTFKILPSDEGYTSPPDTEARIKELEADKARLIELLFETLPFIEDLVLIEKSNPVYKAGTVDKLQSKINSLLSEMKGE